MAESQHQLDERQVQMQARMAALKTAERRAQALQRKEKMEASVTTLNISAPETPAVETVTLPASVLADLQAQLDELKAAKQPSAGMSYDQLLFLLGEMKKPGPEEQARLDAEKNRVNQNRQNMIELTLLEEQETNTRQANCSHRKENNRTAFVVANEKDGLFRYICQHCFKLTDQTKAPPENMGISTGGSFQFS